MSSREVHGAMCFRLKGNAISEVSHLIGCVLFLDDIFQFQDGSRATRSQPSIEIGGRKATHKIDRKTEPVVAIPGVARGVASTRSSSRLRPDDAHDLLAHLLDGVG